VLDDANSTNSGGLTIATGATVQIGSNDANGALPAGPISDDGTLIFDQTINNVISAGISGSGSLAQHGSGEIILSGANGYTGNTTVMAGELALTNSGSIADSVQVSVTGATLDVSGVSGITILNALNLTNTTLNVAVGYAETNLNVASLNLGGANTINVRSLPPISSYPATLTLLYSSGAINGFNTLSLGALPSGSPSYQGSISESGGNSIVLTLTQGPAGVRPYVLWTGVDAINNNILNWSDGTNWLSPAPPVPGDNIIFNDTGSQGSSPLGGLGNGPGGLNPASFNNVVDNNFTVSSITYTNINAYQNTYINNGKTLTITNSLTIGSSSADFGSSAYVAVTVAGTNGTLNVNNTNSTLFVGLVSASASGEQGGLDLSALGTFNASVSSFAVGAIATTADFVSGTAYLAQTNTITAVGGANAESGQDGTLSLMVGQTGDSASMESFLYLGQQNTINASYIGIGIAKDSGEMEFNPIYANNSITPAATIYGGDGVSPVSVWSIGDALGQTGTSAAPAGTADFTGGTVNALVSTMYLGRTANVSGGQTITGTLTFGAGTISVGSLYDGYQAYSSNEHGQGVVNVNGPGTLAVNTLNLAFTTGGSGASTTTGKLNINGGAVQAGTIAGDTDAAGKSTISLNAGMLVITNTAGTTGEPLTALNLAGGTTLQLDVNGSANVTNIVATTVTTGGTTILQIGALTGVTTGVTYPLISYTGSDPFGGLSAVVLPNGYTGTLVDNSGIVGLSLTVVPPPPEPAHITGISVSGMTLNLSATNGVIGGRYVLIGTTNLAKPLSQWTPILTNNFNGSGNLNLSTNIINPAVPQQFYIIEQ
jgi:fibronectin-binding autotransporter adhesin